MRDYNFFEVFQKKRNQSFNIKSPVFLGLIAIILILGVSGTLFLQNIILAAGFTKATMEFQELQRSEEYQEADRLQRSVTAMGDYDQYASAALDRIHQGDILNTEFLNKLTRSMPSTASLEKASLTKEAVIFEFRVPDRRVAAELLENMNRSELFVQTALVSITSEPDVPGYLTEISGIIKAGEQE